MNTAIQVAVGARNASGQPELVKVIVSCTQQQIDDGDHYDLASDQVSGEGYEVTNFVFDEKDPAWLQMTQRSASGDDHLAEQICIRLGVSVHQAQEDEIAGRWDWIDPSRNGSETSFEHRADAARNAVETLLPRADWVYEVSNGDTTLGYFDWALDKAEQQANEEPPQSTLKQSP